MPIDMVITFTLRAGAFSLMAGALYAVLRILWLSLKKKKAAIKPELLRLAFVLYLAALMQITVIRSGVDWQWMLTAKRGLTTIQLYPLVFTLLELRDGLWAFIYPVVGNMVWFLPLGLFLSMMKPGIRLRQVALCGLCLSCSIEGLQWIFGSGISDIDDIIFNVLGTAMGFWAFRWYKKLLSKRQR